MKLHKLVGVIAVSALFLGACEDETETNDKEQAEETKQTEENTETEEVAENENVVDYEIINDSDVSFADSTRHSYWVYPENGEMTKEEFIATSEKFTEDVKEDYDFSAISIYYIDNPENPVGYQIGMAEYAPNGEWDEAENVNDGDYSTHEFNFDYIK